MGTSAQASNPVPIDLLKVERRNLMNRKRLVIVCENIPKIDFLA
jgi:hypothetical protein